MAKALIEDAKKLVELSSDYSPLLSHLIRYNTDPPRTRDEARDILKSILGLSDSLSEPCLRASPVGWYSSCAGPVDIFNHESRSFDRVSQTPAVCFTNSTLGGLSAHRDVFKAQYGLAFGRDFLYEQGANPCLDIRSDLFKKDLRRKEDLYSRKLYNFLPKQLLPFVNIINQDFDATHEREWRIARDFKFQHSDVRYVFCPESDFALFSIVQTEGIPVLLDLDQLPAGPTPSPSTDVRRQHI